MSDVVHWARTGVCMSTFRCLYCRVEKNCFEDSDEHVVPDSLGGSLTIRGVCQKCNNTFGSEVESEKGLLRYPMVSVPAWQLGIVSRKGKSRAIRDKAARVTGGLPPQLQGADVRLDATLASRGQWSLSLVPQRVGDTLFIGEQEDMERYGARVVDRMRRQHGPDVLVTFDEFEIDLSQLTFEARVEVDSKPVGRAIAKMALCWLSHELGHEVALQPSYDAIRVYVHSGHEACAPCDLLHPFAYFGGEQDPPFVTLIEVMPTDATPTDATPTDANPSAASDMLPPPWHTLTLMEAEGEPSEIFCYVMLFGASSYLVRLGEGHIPDDAKDRVLLMNPALRSHVVVRRDPWRGLND